MSRILPAVIGIGIGVALLLLAVASFAKAATWGGLGRDGAQVGYTLIGIFFVIAGGGGIAAILNHQFRVLADPAKRR